MSFENINQFPKPIIYEICKNLDNASRSRFFRACKRFESFRNEEIYQKLFCKTFGMKVSFEDFSWEKSYNTLKEIFSAKAIKIGAQIDKKLEYQLAGVHTVKYSNLGEYIRGTTSFEDQTCWKIYEKRNEKGSFCTYYTRADSETRVFWTVDNKIVGGIRNLSNSARGMTILGENDIGMILLSSKENNRKIAILNMHTLQCLAIHSISQEVWGICSLGTQVFVEIGSNYHHLDFLKNPK